MQTKFPQKRHGPEPGENRQVNYIFKSYFFLFEPTGCCTFLSADNPSAANAVVDQVVFERLAGTNVPTVENDSVFSLAILRVQVHELGLPLPGLGRRGFL